MADILRYREVRQRFSVRVADGPDEDDLPDMHTVSGVVTFTPKLERGDTLVYPEEFVVPRPIVARVVAGELFANWISSDQEPTRPLFLPVTVDSRADQSWAWEMEVSALYVDGAEFSIGLGSRTFQVPDGEDPLWLSSVVGTYSRGVITTKGERGASVVGGRDLGDGTVVFLLSDGSETDPVGLPPGPAGRGIVSVDDPDGDGTATVTYSDGETAPLPLPPGPAGPDGRDEDGRLHSTPIGGEVFFEDLGDAVATASDAHLLGQELLRINQQLTSGTGTRNLTGMVSDATGGQVLISRRGPVVELALVNLLMSGAAAWSQLLTLPVGFRPALAAAEAALIPQGASSGVISVRRSDGRVDINRLGPTVRHKLTFVYMTGDPWPTVLPGTPA